jgi:hypothetical protein
VKLEITLDLRDLLDLEEMLELLLLVLKVLRVLKVLLDPVSVPRDLQVLKAPKVQQVLMETRGPRESLALKAPKVQQAPTGIKALRAFKV